MSAAAGAPEWAAVYRASLYAFRDDDGRWRRFTLDAPAGGLPGLRHSVTLITAWNPLSREMPRAWNEDANRRLAAALAAAAVPFTPAFGASLPGVAPAWREDGFALAGLSRAGARAWGRDWQQRALVYLAPGEAALLFCDGGEDVACGAREQTDAPA